MFRQVIKKPALATVEKKPLHLVLTFWGMNQNKKTRNTMKSTLHCCKLQVSLKQKKAI